MAHEVQEADADSSALRSSNRKRTLVMSRACQEMGYMDCHCLKKTADVAKSAEVGEAQDGPQPSAQNQTPSL